MNTRAKILVLLVLLSLLATGAVQAMPPHPALYEAKPGEGYKHMETGEIFIPPVSIPGRLTLDHTTGEQRVLILRVEFENGYFPVKYDQEYYEDLLFNPANPGSMYSYYNEVSYGNLILTGGFAPVIRLDKRLEEYTLDPAIPPYKIIEEVLAKLDEQGFDFSPYDQDGDGLLDHLIAIHATRGQEVTGKEYHIWSHRGEVRNGGYLTHDGVLVKGYILAPYDGPVGLFCHEFGHDLGLPDLYDRDGSSAGVGKWSLMSSGSWNDEGNTPAHITAWEKYQLGWLTPIDVMDNTEGIQVSPLEEKGEAYRIWTDGYYGHEYFIVENRQRVGYDRFIPGEGLLIFHVNESQTQYNDDEMRYMVGLEQADGLMELERYVNSGDAGDPFPGSTGNTAFTPVSRPNSKSHDGHDTYVVITNITENDQILSFDVSLKTPEIPQTPVGISPVKELKNFQPAFKWTAVNGAYGYELQVATSLDFAADSLVVDTRGRDLAENKYFLSFELEENETYFWRVRAVNSSGTSQWSDAYRFETPGRGKVLVVFDASRMNELEYLDYYEKALREQRISYNLWVSKENGPVSWNVIRKYPILIWAVPWGAETLWDIPDESNWLSSHIGYGVNLLKDYLDNGGKLFISGMDIGWGCSKEGYGSYFNLFTDFLSNYLKAEYVTDNTRIHELAGSPGNFLASRNYSISGGDGANNQLYPDGIRPLDPARSLLQYRGEKNLSAALTCDTGNYRVVYFAFGFEAIDGAGARREVMGRVMDWLQGSPGAQPVIYDLRVSDSFSLASPELEVKYKLSCNAVIEAKIKDEDGRIVRHFEPLIQSSGENSFIWDGLDDRGINVREGCYSLKLEVFDHLGNKGMGAEKEIDVIDASNNLVSLNVEQRDFSAEGLENLKVTLQLLRGAYLDIQLFNPEGQKAAEIANNRYFPQGETYFEWNGLDINGQPVPAGNYYLVVRGTEAGSFFTGRISITIDNDRQVISDVILRTPFVSSNSKTISYGPKSLIVSFELAKEGYLEAWIENELGEKIINLKDDEEVTRGYNTIQWDTRVNGNYVRDGQYYVVFRSRSKTGFWSPVEKHPFVVDNTPAEVEILSLNPEVITNRGDGPGKTEISFVLKEEASLIVVRILDLFSGRFIKELDYDLEKLGPGYYTVIWNGLAEDEVQPTDDGKFYVLIRTIDRSLNIFDVVKPVYVDNLSPEVDLKEISLDKITPNNDNINDEVEFLLDINEPAYLDIGVYQGETRVDTVINSFEKQGKDNITVLYKPDEKVSINSAESFAYMPFVESSADNFFGAGEHWFTWDGLDLDGTAFNDGEYVIRVFARDVVGNETEKPLEIRVNIQNQTKKTLGPSGGEITLSDGTAIIYEQGSLQRIYEVRLEAVDCQEQKALLETSNLIPTKVVRKVSPEIELNYPAIIVLPYNQEALVGMNPEYLRAYQWLDVEGQYGWFPLESWVNPENQTVTARLTKVGDPGLVALMANMESPNVTESKLLGSLTFNYNPFSPNDDGIRDQVSIRYSLLEDGLVTLEIYNSSGQLIRSFYKKKELKKGYYSLTWDGKVAFSRKALNGIYLVRLEVVTSDGRRDVLIEPLGIIK